MLATSRKSAITEMYVLQAQRKRIEQEIESRGYATPSERAKLELIDQDLTVYTMQLQTRNGRSILGTPRGEYADRRDPPAADQELERQ